MGVNLILLDGVRWKGTPVAGDRPQALLAALAGAGGRAVPAERLVTQVWRGEPPANAAKTLQVVVSRARTIVGAGTLVRDGGGYRLALPPAQIDSCLLAGLVAQAGRLLADDPVAAAGTAREALTLGASVAPPRPGEDGPLADVRRQALAELAAARAVLARASSRTGAHADALPLLADAFGNDPGDEGLLADLLRSEAAVRGPGAALDRFERYRRDLRDRLGSSPGGVLVRVQRELLAADRPVRAGIRHGATRLLGRDRDLAGLRAMLAEARVVSIVGPGGLGKTRLAQVLARDSALPVVRVVELVGIGAPEDLLGEVGSALGVRDSISSRRVLTSEQRADLRVRIAQQLSTGPSLLVLDNCEHLVGAVAELVAFLVAAAADLRVLTTSRAPLAISAERVYPLGVLAARDAAELFGERAAAARPGARLDPAAVASIVGRLDGLPLAVELAAARVRAMSVEEIDRRLADRFALLRGGDRSAPDRHRTLLAVIEWSWNLLAEAERRALRWLAVFQDGFTLDTAEEILAAAAGSAEAVEAVDVVQSLVDQSLLGVRETSRGVRYQMLETVREFGLLRLAEAGELAALRRARRRWAVGYAGRHGEELHGEGQFHAVDAIAAEESNLADELRAALADDDREPVMVLVAVLTGFWEIRGEHLRILVLAEAISGAFRGWEPPAAVVPGALAAAAAVLRGGMALGESDIAPVREFVARHASAPSDPRVTALLRVLMAEEPVRPDTDTDTDIDTDPYRSQQLTLERLAGEGDRLSALTAMTWLTHVYENTGDCEAAVAVAEGALALARPEDGPWITAGLRAQLAALTLRLGRPAAMRAHAWAALPVMQRLGALDDAAHLRTLLATDAIHRGEFDEAEELLAGLGPAAEGPGGEASGVASGVASGAGLLLGGMMANVARAELTTLRGHVPDGLDQFLAAARQSRAVRVAGMRHTGLEPWLLFGEAVALAAYARYAAGAEQVSVGRELYSSCLARSESLLTTASGHVDYPVFGSGLFAIGAWLLRFSAELPGPVIADVVRLLVLARRFGYIAHISPLDWTRVQPLLQRCAPGLLAAVEEEYGDGRGSALLAEARGAVTRLARSQGPAGPGSGRPSEAAPVGEDRQRQEDGDHDQAGEQRPADLAGDRPVVGQVPGRRDEV
ncbi:putative ATPase [Frankia sp. EI5c]|nr:putative ATPase [Frankia sp. EI5c]